MANSVNNKEESGGMMESMLGMLNFTDNIKDHRMRKIVEIALDVLIIGVGAYAVFGFGGGISSLGDGSMMSMGRVAIGAAAMGGGLAWLIQDTTRPWRKEIAKIAAVVTPIFTLALGIALISVGMKHGAYLGLQSPYFYIGLCVIPLACFAARAFPRFKKDMEVVEHRHSILYSPSNPHKLERRAKSKPEESYPLEDFSNNGSEIEVD